jgi:FxsC-like protein
VSENTRAGARDSYFFLSYAHSPPLGGTLAEGQAPDPPDAWVSMFFHDLTEAVRSRAVPPVPDAPGFFDQAMPVGSDWKAKLSRALGTAEVFVPLYSPEYRSRSWPGQEWACYQRRLVAAGIEKPLDRFAPVLWIPLPAGQQMPGLREAEELAPEAAAGPYKENGLRALLRLAPYRHSYHLVVERLAARIVRLAERVPIGPSWVPDIDDVESAFNQENSPAVFVVVIVAPALDGAPDGSDRDAYGPAGRSWRPFGKEQELPLAEYARLVAERLGFAVLVTDDPQQAGTLLKRRSGVVVIDPWYISAEDRRKAFGVFARELPSWALPLVVPDPSAFQLAEDVRDLLRKPGISRSEPAKHGLRGVGSLREFVALMPFLVAQAEREYLRRGPIQRSTAPPRPHLAGLAGENANSAEEKPDA